MNGQAVRALVAKPRGPGRGSLVPAASGAGELVALNGRLVVRGTAVVAPGVATSSPRLSPCAQSGAVPPDPVTFFRV